MRSNKLALSLVSCLGVAVVTTAARAEGPHGLRTAANATQIAARAHCDLLHGVAKSESAPMLMPALFAAGGIVTGVEGDSGTSALEPTPRITAGLTYGISGLVRGVATRRRADAECVAQTAFARLAAFVQTYRDGESRKALQARLVVLEGGLNRAEAIVERTRGGLREGRATVDELTAVQLRLDELRLTLAQTRRDVESLTERAQPTLAQIAADVRSFADAEAEAERQSAIVRRSTTWDVAMRGGYDRFYGVRDHTPLFGMATVTLSLGMLVQFGSDADAIAARREVAANSVDGPLDRVRQVLVKVEALRKEAKERIGPHGNLVAELEQRFKTLDALGRDSTRAIADGIWFEHLKAKADQAYLEVLLVELEEVLKGAEAAK